MKKIWVDVALKEEPFKIHDVDRRMDDGYGLCCYVDRAA
jgi:hypothetical protein